MARPKKPFDTDQFEKLCQLQCTQEEIANWFDMTRDTLIERIKEAYNGESFSTVFKRHSDEGRMSLRRIQFRMAEKSAAMAIFLGKQYLGQKDEPMIDQSRHNHIGITYKVTNGNRTPSEPNDRIPGQEQVPSLECGEKVG